MSYQNTFSNKKQKTPPKNFHKTEIKTSESNGNTFYNIDPFNSGVRLPSLKII